MSMAAGTDKGGYSSAINMTPMIDVLLVLLIIFMMQVSLSREVMKVQLPPQQQPNQQQESSQSNQIVLSLLADGGYAINSEPVAFSQLDARLHQIYDTRPAKLMFVRTAPNRAYGEVIEAMDIARSAGVQVIGLTPPELSGGG
ncbi:MAG: biopolymer transporter ExbD [Gemmatimonadetes bacterium]|nr:biopolymer transporter ExbD [Gemmatimonadota bacterium]